MAGPQSEGQVATPLTKTRRVFPDTVEKGKELFRDFGDSCLDKHGTEVTWEERLRWYSDGCGRCRNRPACAPSCWRMLTYKG